MDGNGRAGGRRAGALFGTAVAVAVAVSPGCGPPDAEARSGPLARTPVRGGVLRLVQEAPASLDPVEASSVYESFPVNQIFDGLVAIDAGLGVVPALASSWRVDRDGLGYQFELRSDARFHDGEPVTADDVVFTFRRVLDPRAEGRSLVFPYLAVIEGAEAYARGESDDLPGVRALDDHTVRLRLTHPHPAFLEILAMDGLKVVPRTVLERAGAAAFEAHPVGTGPFRLAERNEDGLRLAANPDYFGGAPHLDEVDLRFLRHDESDGGAERYYRGEIDVLEPPTEELPRLSADPETKVVRYQELSLAFLGLSTRIPPLDRPGVRQAIAHAVDRHALVADAPVVRREATGILPPGMAAYSPEPKGLEHDPARARELLETAGFGPSRPMPPVPLYTSSRSPSAVRTLERIVADLEEVGIEVDVRVVTWSELAERIDARAAPLFLLAWVADIPDPDAYLRSLFESGVSGNYFGYDDAETDAMLREGTRVLNPIERAELYRRIERHVLAQAPIVPLYHTMGAVAVRTTVHGFEPGPMGTAGVPLERVWIGGGAAR